MHILTMTDLRFLPQTLNLHRSLVAHAARFRMTVLCMDRPSLGFLRGRGLAEVKLVELSELERADPAFGASKDGRSWTEYCWTATPAFCAHALERSPTGEALAWIDADVEFMRDPSALLDELGGGSILLTPHRYQRAYPVAAPAYELTAKYGRFNGGTITFRHDADGLEAVRLWRERTIGWCREACEPGRYGNQLHLDDFPQRFTSARVLGVPGSVLGPWNGGGFRVRGAGGGPTADGRPVIAYHYQSLRLGHRRGALALRLSPNVFGVPSPLSLEARAESHYRLSISERRLFWHPHVRRLGQAVAEVLRAEPRWTETLALAPTGAQVRGTIREGVSLESSRIVAPPYRALRAALARTPGSA